MKVKKEYDTVLVKQKNGRIVPITKRTKQCPVCGLKMYLDQHKKGGVHKRARTTWCCSEETCKHKELEEGTLDKYIRRGIYDKSIGILPLTDTDNI